jgi:hypothetical protein
MLLLMALGASLTACDRLKNSVVGEGFSCSDTTTVRSVLQVVREAAERVAAAESQFALGLVSAGFDGSVKMRLESIRTSAAPSGGIGPYVCQAELHLDVSPETVAAIAKSGTALLGGMTVSPTGVSGPLSYTSHPTDDGKQTYVQVKDGQPILGRVMWPAHAAAMVAAHAMTSRGQARPAEPSASSAKVDEAPLGPDLPQTTQTERSQERVAADIRGAAVLAVSLFRQSGMTGLIVKSKECYERPSYGCVYFDFAAKRLGEIAGEGEKLPVTEYFADAQMLPRVRSALRGDAAKEGSGYLSLVRKGMSQATDKALAEQLGVPR